MKNNSEQYRFGPPADGLDSPTEQHIPLPENGLDSPTEQYIPPAKGVNPSVGHNIPLPPTEEFALPAGNSGDKASSAFRYDIPPQARLDGAMHSSHQKPIAPPVAPTYAPQITHPAVPFLAPPADISPKKNQGSSIAIIIASVVLVLCVIAGAIGIWYMGIHDDETDHAVTVHNSTSKPHKNSTSEAHKNHQTKTKNKDTDKKSNHEDEDDSNTKQKAQNQTQSPSPTPTQPSPSTPAPSYIDARGYVVSVFNGQRLAVSPSCNGDAILIHNSVVEQPGIDTGSAIEAALNAAPAGAVYTTPGACPSLRAQTNGANIYAVYTNYGSNVNAMCSAYAVYGGIPRTLNSAGDFTNPCGY